MLAYILQMLFFALTTFSVVIMFVMIIKNMKATKKQWRVLFLPILLLFMVMAYRFDFNANITSDLNRWFVDFDGFRRYGFDYEMRYADEFSWFWRVIAYVFAHVDNLHWFPVFSVAVDFGVFFYILSEVAEEKQLEAYDILCCIVLRLAFMPIIASISACRNVLAYVFFSLGYYTYYKHGLKNWFVYIWMILGVLTHSTVFLAVAIFVLSFFVQKYRKSIILFAFVGVCFAVFVAPMLAESSNDMFAYFGERWDTYLDNPNYYEAIKAQRIATGLLPLFICIATWYLGKERSLQKPKISYIVSNIAATLGVYAFMPELFVRMSYPSAMLVPVLWSELRSTDWRRPEKGRNYAYILILVTMIAFIGTFGAWFWEIYWFFEV